MSGHSKWATIKHAKGAADAKRGQLFTKLAKEIIIAAKDGGGDINMNAKLRMIVSKAKAANMPNDNIERAIKKGTGEIEGGQIIEMTMEGYGPGGAAILVDILADNRMRAIQEVRANFSRGGGSLGENGSVAWQFEPKGIITLDITGKDPDEITLLAIDAGADDVKQDGTVLEIITDPQNLENVKNTISEAGWELQNVEFTKIAKNTMELEEATALSVLRLMSRLEDLDDVNNVTTNVNFSNEVLEKFED
ncbi:MAG: YebC/PmpR family DNA-binding transcriptional regulator [Chloroflexi bacterium]|nr:YebC/PmpR family DNA-binding transcriptional regulator [Chloroflexota bacterium]